jgi:hypothetical protein
MILHSRRRGRRGSLRLYPPPPPPDPLVEAIKEAQAQEAYFQIFASHLRIWKP